MDKVKNSKKPARKPSKKAAPRSLPRDPLTPLDRFSFKGISMEFVRR